MTAQYLINGALRLLGVVDPTEGPEATEAAICLSALNALLASWSTESLSVYTMDHPVFTLQAGKQDYTMGPGQDFDFARPLKITQMFLRVTVGPTTPYDIAVKMVDDEEWGSIPLKNISGHLPWICHNHGEYPVTTLSFYPKPDAPNQVVIYQPAALNGAATLGTEMLFPPGYERALRYNLAVEVAPEFDVEPSAAVVAVAVQSKANIQRLNNAAPSMACDNAILNGGGLYDFRTGQIR